MYMSAKIVRKGLLLSVACLVFSACATPRFASPHGERLAESNSLLDRQPARKELGAAENLLKSGNPYSAIPRLLRAINKYPESRAGIDARFVLGRTYYEVNSFALAHDSLSRYLERAPGGQYAAEAREMITRLEQDARERYPTRESIEPQAQALRAEIAKGNGTAGTHTALADLLWRQKRYEESAEAYLEAITLFPDLASDEVLRRRVEIGEDGTYTILTPDEVMRRDRESNPLRIFNVTAFPAQRNRRTLAYTRYVVAGQVTNWSSSPLRNVEVHVTLYGFANAVYDTRTQRFGTLQPGQSRAFSLRFANFDDLNRIDRYECVGTYER